MNELNDLRLNHFNVMRAGMFHQIKSAATESLETALQVLQRGWVTIDQLRYANDWRMKQCPRIGKMARIMGKLSTAQVLDVLAEQRSNGKAFGEAAVDLGLLNHTEVCELLLLQAKRVPLLESALLKLGMITPEQADWVTKECNAFDQTLLTKDEFFPVMMS